MSTPADSVARLREPHYVYRLYDADDVLLYVGCTYSPRKRLRAHAAPSGSRWFAEVVRTEVTEYPDAITAMEAEEAAHREERPKHSLNGYAALGWARRVLAAEGMTS